MEGSRGVDQTKIGDMTVQHRLRPEAAAVHRLQDLERAEDRDLLHHLAPTVVNFIGESADLRLEHVLAVESRAICDVTVHIHTGEMHRPPPSPQYREVEDVARRLVLHRLEADRGLRVHTSRPSLEYLL